MSEHTGEIQDPERDRGLYEKYRVERTDGKAVGRCIVLELHDPNAWDALLTWADTVERDGYVALAADVRRWVITEQDITRAAEGATEAGPRR